MKKKIFTLSYEMVIFNKDNKVINKGTCRNTNGLKDYRIIKTYNKGEKTYIITEKYYDNEFYSKEFEVHNRKDYYIVSAYTCPLTNTHWTYDTRDDK